MQHDCPRILDAETHDYLVGLRLGLIDIGYEMHNSQWKSARSEAVMSGYHDALDDSDDYPEPFDPEKTLVP